MTTSKEFAKEVARLMGEYLAEIDGTSPPIMYLMADGQLHVYYVHPEYLASEKYTAEFLEKANKFIAEHDADAVALSMELWEVDTEDGEGEELLQLVERGLLEIGHVATNQAFVMAVDRSGERVQLTSTIIEEEGARVLLKWEVADETPLGLDVTFTFPEGGVA